MLRIILVGCHGRMGQQLVHTCSESDITISAGVDHRSRPSPYFPVFQKPDYSLPAADILLDFSRPEALTSILEFCTARKLPAVLAVTGYSSEDENQIAAAAQSIPIFRASNLSIGANIMYLLTEYAASLLGADFDTAIIERHHKSKLDSPSGTALCLSKKLPASTNIVSIRAGTTAGEHTVMFAGKNEVLELSHRADTRDTYAAGAIRAARFLSETSKPGVYGMQHLLYKQNFPG